MTREYKLSIFQITTMNSEIKGVLSKALLVERYIFPVDMIDEILLASEVNFSENEKDYIDYFNKLLSEITSFRIHSLDIKEVSVEFNNFCIDEIKKDNSNAADHLAKELNPITDENISKLTKGCVEIQFSSIYTIIQNLDKLIKVYVHEYTKVYALETTKTEETKPEVIDVETIIVPSDAEINNSVDINKELDEEAQEEIPDEEVMNDAEEAQEEIPDEEVMNDAEIKEEKNEETIAEDQEEAQEEKKEETIVSSSSEAAERFITDEDLLEKVGDKFFEEAKDKISKIAKNKSLAKKQKKNRINRIVKSYSHKVKEDNELDPIKEAERKEKIITETVEERKPIEPKVRYIKDFKDLNDKLAHNEEVLTTFKNAKFDKMVADIIRKYPAITINKFDNIYRLDIDKMDQNGRVFEDTFFISFDQEYDVIDGNRKGTKIGGPIIIAFKNNKYLATGLTLDTFNYIIINGSWVLPDDGISTNNIGFEIKRAS